MTICDFCGKDADIAKLEVWTIGEDPSYVKDIGDMCEKCRETLEKQREKILKKFKQ